MTSTANRNDAMNTQPDLANSEFPVDSLPPVCRDLVHAMAYTIQAPTPICAASALTVASLAAQPLADIELPSMGVTPLSLFFLSIAKTGERKSAADKVAMGVINEIEARIERNTDSEARPMLFSDLTIEGLDTEFDRGARSLALVNDDGGQVTSARQASDDGKTKFLTGISKAWDATPRKVLRKRSGRTWVIGKRLTTHLMLQPILATDLLNDNVWTQQGALPRFLVAWPASRIGTRRLTDWTTEGKRAYQAFQDRMATLLGADHPTHEHDHSALSPPSLPLRDEARQRWINFYDEIESQIGDNGPLCNVQGFGAKLPEHAGRLAGVFAVVEQGPLTAITEDQMDRAIRVAWFYLGEILRANAAAQGEALKTRASKLDDWLAERDNTDVCLSELMQRGPGSLRKKEILEPLIQILVERGRLVPREGGKIWNGSVCNRAYRIVTPGSPANSA